MLKKATPFFLLAIASFIYAVYILSTDETGWGIFAVFLLIVAAIALFLFDFGLKHWLKAYPKILLVELGIAGLILAFNAYQYRTKTLLISDDFDQEYVTIVYGIENTPDLSISPFTIKKDIEIPASGVLLTSSEISEDLPKTEIKTKAGIYPNSDKTDQGFAIMATSEFQANGQTYHFRTWKIESEFCCGYSASEVQEYKLLLQNTFEKMGSNPTQFEAIKTIDISKDTVNTSFPIQIANDKGEITISAEKTYTNDVLSASNFLVSIEGIPNIYLSKTLNEETLFEAIKTGILIDSTNQDFLNAAILKSIEFDFVRSNTLYFKAILVNPKEGKEIVGRFNLFYQTEKKGLVHAWMTDEVKELSSSVKYEGIVDPPEIPKIENLDFEAISVNTRVKELPLVDTANFDNFSRTDFLSQEEVITLDLDEIYPEYYKEGYNYKTISNYTISLSENFRSLVLTTFKGDHEMESILVNYNFEDELIDYELISYDEIAEGWSRVESKIEKNLLTVNHILWVEDKQVETKVYDLEANGKITLVSP